MIPMLDLRYEYEWMQADIDAAVAKCLLHQRWINGPEVGEFERSVATYLGVKHAIGVASGTDALVLALRAEAIKYHGCEYFSRTDKIITAPFTFAATGDAILRAGATPVFVDIDLATFNISMDRVVECIGADVRVVGVVPVHLFGLACKLNGVPPRIFVVEDCAQSFGAKLDARYLGTIGNAGAFSFFPSKNLGCFGDGGMVTTDDDDLADMVRWLARHGGKNKNDCQHIGYNSRLDTLQAAILLAKLRHIDELNDFRRQNAVWYTEELFSVDGVVLPVLPMDTDSHVFHQYTIRVLDGKRDALAAHLNRCGIDTMVYYATPLYGMKLFADRGEVYGSLVNAYQAAEEVLSLPIEPLMARNDIAQVGAAIREFYA